MAGLVPATSRGGTGGGSVNSVTAGDATIVVGGTAADPTVVVGKAPGYEFGYDEITTTSITVASTTEATPTTIIACAAHTFDGSPVIMELSPYGMDLTGAAATGTTLILDLYEGVTILGRIVTYYAGATLRVIQPLYKAFRFTPSAGSHTYTIGGWKAFGATGTAAVLSGAGGSGVEIPTNVRFIKE